MHNNKKRFIILLKYNTTPDGCALKYHFQFITVARLLQVSGHLVRVFLETKLVTSFRHEDIEDYNPVLSIAVVSGRAGYLRS